MVLGRFVGGFGWFWVVLGGSVKFIENTGLPVT